MGHWPSTRKTWNKQFWVPKNPTSFIRGYCRFLFLFLFFGSENHNNGGVPVGSPIKTGTRWFQLKTQTSSGTLNSHMCSSFEPRCRFRGLVVKGYQPKTTLFGGPPITKTHPPAPSNCFFQCPKRYFGRAGMHVSACGLEGPQDLKVPNHSTVCASSVLVKQTLCSLSKMLKHAYNS